MTMEELKAALKADQEKAKAFEEALAGMTPERAGSDAEAVSLAAAAAGFEITPEEVERCAASDMEADDAELANVTGGDSSGRGDDCTITWHCYYTFCHNFDSDDNTYYDDTECWSNHYCLFSHHKYCGSGLRIGCLLTWEWK